MVPRRRVQLAFNWLGSKFSMLDTILPNIPPHVHYVEPFMGTAVVFFNKKPAKISTLNDLDGNIVNFFRVLQDRKKTAELLRRLKYTLWAREEYRRACLMLSSNRELDEVLRAWAFFVAQTMSIQHSYYRDPKGGQFGYRRGTGKSMATEFISRLRTLISLSSMLRTAQIENEDGIKVIQRYDHESAFMFIDPPYPSYTVLDKKSPYALPYNDRMHEELIRVVSGAKSKIMLASYPNPLYDTLLSQGWIRIDKEKRVTAATVNRQMMAKYGKVERPRRIESLYLNYTPPCAIL